MLTRALHYAITLMQQASITPDDHGCQDFIEQALEPLGFSRQRIDCGGVSNSIYLRPGEANGVLGFAGHTDVVPVGPPDLWLYPPFSATVAMNSDGHDVLHGRGAQDMKGGIACFMAAIAYLHAHQIPLPSLQLLITSDEEGESIDGTIRLVEHLEANNALPDAVVVGEPSCRHQVGDTIRRGRRGVAQAKLCIRGQQGHSAYPADADNAIHRALPVLQAIAALDWGTGCDGFPATTCQITNLQSGTGAMNVIPGDARATLDIRYNPSNNFEEIRQRIEACCADVQYEVEWNHVAIAFSTPDGAFLDLVSDSIHRATGLETVRDTGGGTSDGRFLAAAGVPVAEIGLTNSTIHQTGECVAVDELAQLSAIYAQIIEHFPTMLRDE
jgi:succinyl-diaminopimelate desuccinylase